MNCEDKENLLSSNAIECVKQLNNSLAVVDLVSGVIEHVFSRSYSGSDAKDWQSKVQEIIVSRF